MYRLQRDKNINLLFYTAVTSGLMLALMHLTRFLFDMALSIVFYGKTNLTSIIYLICHLLIMYIPLLLLIPNLKTPKAIILKWIFRGISVCYLLGCSWIIFYMIDHSTVLGIFTASPDDLYTYQRNTALMFNYMTWNCYSLTNVLYSLIQAFLFFIVSESLFNHKAVFGFFLTVSTLFTIVVVAVYTIFSPEGISYADYGMRLSENFVNTVFILGSQFLSSIALISISTSPRLWEKFLWSFAEKR